MPLFSYRYEEHCEEIDHGLHVETPLGGNTGCRQEHQTADGGQQHLGDKRSHCDSNKRPQDFWKTWKDLRDCLLVSNCQIFWRSDQKRD